MTTNQLKEIIKKDCPVCNGTGVEYIQPYGNAQICSFCYGSGKQLNIFEMSEKSNLLCKLRR